MYVYDAWKVKPLTVTPFTPSVSLLVVGLQIRSDLDHVPQRRHRARLREVDGARARYDRRRGHVHRPIVLAREPEARLRHQIHILKSVQAHAARVARVETHAEAIENAALHAERRTPRARRFEVRIERRHARQRRRSAATASPTRTSSESSTDPPRTRSSRASARRSRCTRAATPSPRFPSRPRPPRRARRA